MSSPTSTKPSKVHDEIDTITKAAIGGDPFEAQRKLEKNLTRYISNSSSTDENSMPGKGLTHYLMHPKELRQEHPVWHYFYLCTLIFAAFVALFVGPVIFGMLATIGGLGTPVVLSVVGSGVGLLLGLVFGVIFAVVCIVALVRVVGLGAEWVLDTLWFGGNDLLEMSRQHVLALISDNKSE